MSQYLRLCWLYFCKIWINDASDYCDPVFVNLHRVVVDYRSHTVIYLWSICPEWSCILVWGWCLPLACLNHIYPCKNRIIVLKGNSVQREISLGTTERSMYHTTHIKSKNVQYMMMMMMINVWLQLSTYIYTVQFTLFCMALLFTQDNNSKGKKQTLKQKVQVR